jgi:hypothetical protein
VPHFSKGPLTAYSKRQQHCHPARHIHTYEVLGAAPRKRRGEEPCLILDIAVAAKRGTIHVDDHSVRARVLYADPVVREAVAGVEVEGPQEARALEHNDLLIH